YAANPFSCPAGSKVGTATATTPVLPGTLSGPAFLVSHGGAAFPDLDILLEGSGVRVILVGNTNIKGGITSTTFATLPDVPVSRRVPSASRTKPKFRLSRRALRAVAHHHRLKVRVRVAFLASPSSEGRASAATAVMFKR